MKTMTQLVLFSVMMMMVAAPAFAGEATQVWRCEMDDDATEEEMTTMAREWLNAAKKLDGGKGLKAHVYFPIAVNASGEFDIMFVVVAPSFAEWGKFWDGYPNSPAAALEARHNEKVVCPDSMLWESIEVK